MWRISAGASAGALAAVRPGAQEPYRRRLEWLEDGGRHRATHRAVFIYVAAHGQDGAEATGGELACIKVGPMTTHRLPRDGDAARVASKL